MTLITAASITKTFADKTILDNVSFSVKSGDSIGLVGKNGAGKTTLFEIIVGNISPDAGSITKARDCQVEYVLQEIGDSAEQSLFGFVSSARQDLLALRSRLDQLEHYVSQHPNDEKAIEQLGQLQHTFEVEGGFHFESETTRILEGLGFEQQRHGEWLQNFSGGEKNRAALARVLAGRGNLLLLDEPTNHLDIESTAWLEEYLKSSDKAYIIVSHDRAFLEATVAEVWELSLTHLEFYCGGFEMFLNERKERKKLHEHRFKHQQEEIKRIEEFIRRNMAGQKTRQAQSKLKYLRRLKRIAPPREERAGASITMSSSGRSFAHVLSLKDVSLAYGSNTIVKHVSLDLFRGDKVALLGNNGSGKTTLLKALTGELSPVSGEIKLGSNVDVAYFDQELENLNPEMTVLQSAWQLEPESESGKIRSYLARFGFTGDEPLNKVSSLSGGEKTKLSLALLLFHPANFIILDEPTNHLDLDSREALETALQEYTGTLLVVSHDRYFLDKVAARILHLRNGALRSYDGNYSYFREKTLAENSQTRRKDNSAKGEFAVFKEKSKRIARHRKQILSVRQKIAESEKELHRLEEEIEKSIPGTDWEALDEASRNKKQLEETIIELYARLEQLENMRID